MDLSEHRFLVTTDWLMENLDANDLRIVDCTSLLPNYFEASAADGLTLASGRGLWSEGHIPGSTYADILEDLCQEPKGNFMYGMPSAEQFAATMSKLGIGSDSAVVLYDQGMNMWAARLWWMLRSFGFDNAAVLDGGWTKWMAEQRPVSTAAPNYPAAKFEVRARPELIADRDRGLAARDDKGTWLINARDPDEFAGLPPQRYARPGRIPSSVSVPFLQTADADTQVFSDDAGLRATFEDVGAADSDAVICYCGGGIAACSTALALTRLGIDNVSVYDGSLTEWSSDPSLPMEVG